MDPASQPATRGRRGGWHFGWGVFVVSSIQWAIIPALQVAGCFATRKRVIGWNNTIYWSAMGIKVHLPIRNAEGERISWLKIGFTQKGLFLKFTEQLPGTWYLVCPMYEIEIELIGVSQNEPAALFILKNNPLLGRTEPETKSTSPVIAMECGPLSDVNRSVNWYEVINETVAV